MEARSMILDASQEAAVEMMLTARIGAVCGGPGVGKSTCLRTLLDRLPVTTSFELAAPTGKASARLREVTGREARTIHRLLGYNPTGFAFNKQNPLPCDLVVIDEASMLEVELAAALFRAIDPETTRLIFVGDVDQLPPVGPGCPFADLIASGAVPVARLTQLHRAARESWVCRNAQRILAGDMIETDDRQDFRAHLGERDHVIGKAVDEAVKTGAQILVPQKTGPAGAEIINSMVRDRVNPKRAGEPSLGSGATEIRPRDRVIHTRNNYNLGVFNGEVGRVESIAGGKVAVTFEDRAVDYDMDAAGDLRLAYALTIHRCQGSEFPWVIVICYSTHTRMLSRQLFYTAVTRAKQGVVLCGDLQGVKCAIREASPATRNTSLVERLRAEGAAGS